MSIRNWAGVLVAMIRYLSGGAKKYHVVKDPKSRGAMLIDHLRWIWREREFNYHYNSLGLNMKGTDIAGFLGRRSFNRYRHLYTDLARHHSPGGESISEEILIKDKFYCSAILQACGFKVIHSLFVIINGIWYPMTEANTLPELPDGDYFLKNTLMESGTGVIEFTVIRGTVDLSDAGSAGSSIEEITRRGRWIVQEKIFSHPSIRSVNGKALNTTRIYTIATVSGVEYLGGYQAFATGSSTTDSWQYGSVYVSIDPFNNRLGKFGITSQSDPRDGLLLHHPDSKVGFDGYIIPFMEDSVALCRKAHPLFGKAFIIGWDIAITEGGPVVVEANENPGINVLQCFEGGISRRVREAYNGMAERYNE